MNRAVRLFALTGLLVAMTLFSTPAQAAPEKVQALIVTGFDVDSHQWQASTRMIKGILEDSGRFAVDVAEDKDAFAKPSLSDYDVVILNYGFWKEPDPSEAAKAGLLDYVKKGGNLVALHFACSSFQEWDQYATLLGRVWKRGVGGHGPYGKFTVNMRDSAHPITKGVDDFEIEDELYAKLTGDDEIEVLASSYSDWSGKVEPLVFVKSYGDGRVVQNLLGHGLDSKRNASYQELLKRCVEWAATGQVTQE